MKEVNLYPEIKQEKNFMDSSSVGREAMSAILDMSMSGAFSCSVAG